MRVIQQQGKTILHLDDGYELEVRKSRIHGNGVFALSTIPSETRLLEYTGEKITKAESHRRGTAHLETAGEGGRVYIFELNKRYDIDGNVPDNYTRFVNHSCEPNCEARVVRGKIYYYTLREIAPGEELFIDYSYDMEHFLDHPCRCGTASCIGYIVQKNQRWRVRRLLQKKHPPRSLLKKQSSSPSK